MYQEFEYNTIGGAFDVALDLGVEDWVVGYYKGKDGSTKIKLTFVAAIINSSGSKIDINKLIANEIKTFKEVFGQGNVHANLMLREIKFVNELKWNESLIEILASSNFKKTPGVTIGGDSFYGGKYVRINVDAIDEKTSLFKDAKVLIHEIGHTGGLVHPWEFEQKTKASFVNGKEFLLGSQGFSINKLEDATNFMGYSKWGFAEGGDFLNMNFSEEQKLKYFMKNVGKAQQGQVQQIINNLQEGNLNSDDDLPILNKLGRGLQ